MGPNQYFNAELALTSTCGTALTSPGTPFLPGYISMGIGAWTDVTRYPGLENLRWNVGGYDYDDACTGVTTKEVFFGVTTMGGYAASRITSAGFGGTLPLTFIDNAVDALILGATVPGVGGETFHIVDDDVLTQAEYLHLLGQCTDRKLRVLRLPSAAYHAIGLLSEIVAKVKGQIGQEQRPALPMKERHLVDPCAL